MSVVIKDQEYKNNVNSLDSGNKVNIYRQTCYKSVLVSHPVAFKKVQGRLGSQVRNQFRNGVCCIAISFIRAQSVLLECLISEKIFNSKKVQQGFPL